MFRKFATLLVLSLFLALPASAQLPGLSSVGVKGGASFATLRGDLQDEDLGYETGFVGGIYGQAEFIPFFTPRIEALYVQKGASTEVEGDPDLPGGGEGSYDLDYIEIPLLLKFNLPVVDRVFPSLYAGPYVGFAINREAEIDTDQGSRSLDGDEVFDSTDYGLVLGTDVDISFLGPELVLSARYDLGLANVVSDDFDNDADLNTGTFMVTLGFGI